jgi:hypothetical protein
MVYYIEIPSINLLHAQSGLLWTRETVLGRLEQFALTGAPFQRSTYHCNSILLLPVSIRKSGGLAMPNTLEPGVDYPARISGRAH